MNKTFLMVVLMMCQVGCSAQAANPEPIPEPSAVTVHTSGVAEATPGSVPEHDENAEELAEAEREYQEEVAEIKREWAEEQRELREELAEIEREWKAGEYESQEEYNEDLREYHQELAEAQLEMQEELNEALMELEEAKRLSDAVIIKNRGSDFTLYTPPRIKFGVAGFDPFSDHQYEPSILFVPQKPIDGKIAEQVSEDMQVMSIILEKAVDKAVDKAPHSKHGGRWSQAHSGGYKVGLSLFQSSSSDVSEAIYIEDYGILFKLKVDFPLLSLEGDGQLKQPTEKDVQDEIWQRSKNKLKGLEKPQRDDDDAIDFDPEKVNVLRQKLIKTYKHASNIRDLSGDERVVFVVSGHVDGGPGRFYDGSGRKKGDTGITVPTSVMTLQAIKKDIDAFGAGRMNLDAFAKKVSVVVY